MRFLWRNGIFIFFPAVLLAIVFLVRISFGTAVRFGEWGERSIVESTLLVAKEKIERVEETVSTTDSSYYHIVNPAAVDAACDRWQRATRISKLIEAAAIIDDNSDIVMLFYRDETPDALTALNDLFVSEIIPLIDKYESLDQFKHLHRRIAGGFRLITHFSTVFENQDYTTILLYDTDEFTEGLFEELFGQVGPGLMANVVDDQHRIIFGRDMDTTGEFIVARRFPSTLYKWRLQLAPTSAALFTSRAETQRFSQAMLIPLALGVIIFGLIVLYLSVVRERRINRLKSEFIANVSHELKTPLSLIRMFGELFVMGRVKEEARARRYHEIILKETERLTALIDNVLDFARIERGKQAYDFEIADVSEVVERGVELHHHLLEKMSIELQYDPPPSLPSALIDEHAITLAVANLIDNAVKYAQGTKTIKVELVHRDQLIHIDVVDFGIGIPENHLRRIFERFYRVPSKETRKQRGSGIGLSLVRHIAEAHGGTVEVTSVPGEQTRFSIRIPIYKQQREASLASAPSPG